MAGNYGKEYGVVEWLRAHRVELGPVYAAFPVLLFGVAANLLDWIQTLVLIATIGVGCAFWIGRARGWRQPYAVIATAIAVAWIITAHYADSVKTWTWLLVAWFTAGILLAVPWWADHVRRTQVRMENVIRTWSLRSERIGLRGTSLTGMKSTGTGWSAKLGWLSGNYTVDRVMKMRTELEGALGLNMGELRVAPDGRSTNSVSLVAVTKDPHMVAIPWEIPTVTVSGQEVLRRLRASDAFPIGLHEDSTVKKLLLWKDGWGARQVLGAGIKGSGKSNLFNLLWAYFALCTDVVQWGIDLKGGMELGPWAGLFDWIVTTREKAALMMAAADALIEERMAYCKAHKWKVWKVTPETPLVVLTIDEAASLLGDAKSSELHTVEELARKGRAVGLVILIATQYPTLDALGSNQIRQQIDQRFCFRMQDNTGEHYVMPGCTVDAHKIPADRPGTCYHLDGDELDPMPIRTYRMGDETIETLVSLLTGYTCPLDALSSRAAENASVEILGEFVSSGYAERDIPVPIQRDSTETPAENGDETMSEIPEWTENGNVSLEEITAARDAALSETERDALDRARDDDKVTPARLGEEEAYAALLAALRSAGSAGVGPQELMRATTRKSTWLYDKLAELDEAGRARRTQTGVWAWCGASVNSS